MRLHLLGSGAGKPVPRPFCDCPVCRHAKAHGGRDLRSRTSLHVYLDGEPIGEPRYKVDLPPDTGHQMLRDRFNMNRLEHLLITHRDVDHWAPDYLSIRASILSDKAALPTLHVYGSDSVQENLAERIANPEALGIEMHAVAPREDFHAGDLNVQPLLANHAAGTCLNYIVRAEGQSVLLAWDTGWWPDETWKAVSGQVFDAVLMECTLLGPVPSPWSGHLTWEVLLEMRERLITMECVVPTTCFILVRIGDNGGLLHEEAQEMAAPHGITVGYDGLMLNLGEK